MPRWLQQPPNNKPSWTWQYWRRIWDAQPLWADTGAIARIYEDAHRRRQRGEHVVVDHIVPLHGVDICGLHVHTNLRIVTYQENAKRSNLRWPGQPCKQLDLFSRTHACPDFELKPQRTLKC